MYRHEEAETSTVAAENARKLKTRRKLIQAVTELLGEMSTDDIAMHVVAKRAGINITTAYKHFTPKATLFQSVTDPVCEWFTENVDQNIGRTPFFPFVRSIYAQAASMHQNETLEGVIMLRTLALDVQLAGAMRQLEDCQVRELTRYAAHDLGLDPSRDRRPFLIATLIVSVHMEDFRRWAADPDAVDFAASTVESLDAAEKLLREGLHNIGTTSAGELRQSAS